jgi:hypothetical protein
VDSWGSSGKALGLCMRKYKEEMEERTWTTLLHKGADYGRGGGPKAGLCILNRQERWRRLQERMETMTNVFRNSETDWKRL